MRHCHLWKKKLLATMFVCSVPVSATHASGFRVPELSVAGTATSNALVANVDELGAVAYNPAAISFHEGKNVMIGVNSVSYEATVTPAGGTSTDSIGKDHFLIPNMLVSTTDDSGVGFAFLVNSPFGLETQWPDETFPGFAGGLDVLEPELSRIKMLNLSPNLSYKIDTNSSVAFGLNYYDVINLSFNTQNIRIEGTGNGIGFNVGYLHKMDNVNIGISYKSGVSTNIKGHFDARGIGSSVVSASAKLDFPDVLQIGVQYNPTKNLGIEFDLDHTGWSSFDEVKVINSTGGTLTSSNNAWENTWAYRLGFVYKLTPKTKLLFGYTFDESPQPDSNFSARVPDADRQLFSVGASHEFDEWKVEYSYMYVDVDDRTVNSSTAYAGDANGTTLYNGTYQSDVSLIGLSLAMKF